MIGLDTCAIIDIFKGEKNIKNFLEKHKEPLAVNMMNYVEIFFGIDPKNPKHIKESEYYERFFNNFYFVDLTKEVSVKSSEIYWSLKKKGKNVGKFDCLLASCFLTHGIKKIVTKNVKHFKRIKDLEILSY